MSKVLAAVFLLFLCACSYQWQGFEEPSNHSVLGDGTKTVRIANVEQATLHPWIAPYIRSKLRDEIQLRKMAVVVDDGDAEYLIQVRMPSFLIRAVVSDSEDQTLLNAASASLEVEVLHAVSSALFWRSGEVRYAERYEDPNEENMIREVLDQAIYRALDRMQQSF